MQTKSSPPSIMRLFIIGILALIALSGAGVLGYTTASGHMPWVKPTPTIPERPYVSLCTPKGASDEEAIQAIWVRAASFDTNIATQYLASARGRQTAFQAPGTFIQLDLHLTLASQNDGLSCLRVFARWPGMPANVDPSIYGYDFTQDVLPTMPLIQNPGTLKILINMDTSLYTPRPADDPNPLPMGVPVTLTFQVSTVNGRLYTSQANEAYTFIRVATPEDEGD